MAPKRRFRGLFLAESRAWLVGRDMNVPYLAATLPLLATACATVPATDAPIHAIDRSSADHYVWGGVNDGWHLAKQPGLSVIEERIAPGASEIRHYHRRARQFSTSCRAN